MIITKEEFFDMGFEWDDEKQLESCIERAGFVLTALTQGKAAAALAAGGNASCLVKQAAAFQTMELLRREYDESLSESTEKCTVGDFSYSVSCGTRSAPVDTDLTVIALLRAAGCLFGGLEAAE